MGRRVFLCIRQNGQSQAFPQRESKRADICPDEGYGRSGHDFQLRSSKWSGSSQVEEATPGQGKRFVSLGFAVDMESLDLWDWLRAWDPGSAWSQRLRAPQPSLSKDVEPRRNGGNRSKGLRCVPGRELQHPRVLRGFIAWLLLSKVPLALLGWQ